jgi:hypothetical protein
MVKVLWENDRSIPLVICDKCSEPIRDAAMGMVAYSPNQAEGTYRALAFLHKGRCDETYEGGRSREGGWVELSHFLLNLCHNTGMPAGGELMKLALEQRRDLDRLP